MSASWRQTYWITRGTNLPPKRPNSWPQNAWPKRKKERSKNSENCKNVLPTDRQKLTVSEQREPLKRTNVRPVTRRRHNKSTLDKWSQSSK